MGIGGTAVGAVLQEGLVSRRADRRARRRTYVAIVGELLDAVSILHKALERQAWWPEGDEPRQLEWQRHQEALIEVRSMTRTFYGSTIWALLRCRRRPRTSFLNRRLALRHEDRAL